MSQSQKNTTPSTTFLDANVLLEIILGRRYETAAREFIERQPEKLYISALTAHLVVHFGKAIVELPVIRTFLADYTILALDAADFEWAFVNIRNQDFEDALQLAVAVRNGCSQFVTLDKTFAATYHNLIPIQTRLLNEREL